VEIPTNRPAVPRVDWLAVGAYYLIACAVSWPFFWWRDMAAESWRAWQIPNFLKVASFMWGPGVAALVCFVVFRRRHRRTITLLGSSPWRSLAFYLIPLALLGAFGGHADRFRGFPAAGFIAILAFTSIFGEELGWRGFLQDALRPLAPWKRWASIGVLWEFWHFTNRVHSGSWIRIAIVLSISYPAVILLAWIIGKAAEKSRSVLVATSLHLWVDLVFEAFEGSGEGAGLPAVSALAISIAVWWWLLRGWPEPRTSIAAAPAALA